MSINIMSIVEDEVDFDEELWQAACREVDRRNDEYLTPDDVLREWDAQDTYDGYDQASFDLYDRITFDCD